MRLAIAQALKGRGTTPPNPLVGSVIVSEDRVVATGYHERTGHAHAEINALRNLGQSVTEQMVLYVTLEPCSSEGRTGACTNAIIQSGIKQVVIGAIDPNPHHQGNGVKVLEEAGVSVRCHVLGKECRDLNVGFNNSIVDAPLLSIAYVVSDLNGKMIPQIDQRDPWLAHLLALEKQGHIRLVVKQEEVESQFAAQKIDYLFWDTKMKIDPEAEKGLGFQSISSMEEAVKMIDPFYEYREQSCLVRGWVRKEA